MAVVAEARPPIPSAGLGAAGVAASVQWLAQVPSPILASNRCILSSGAGSLRGAAMAADYAGVTRHMKAGSWWSIQTCWRVPVHEKV